jgi:hypothetical protein
VSVQTIAAREPLRWPALIPSAACNRDYCDRNWKRLQFLFPDLADPRLFPPLPNGTFTAAEVSVLRRFQEKALHLAESRVMNSGANMSVSFPNGTDQEPDVEYDFPPEDAIAGFSVLFRQCYSTKEPASFNKVKDLLWKASRKINDEHSAERETALRAWTAAQGALRAHGLMTLCSTAISGRRNEEDSDEGESPEMLISAFNYGADIHWSDKRDTVKLWNDDVMWGPHQRMRFFESTCSLSYIYFGMSQVIGAALHAA